MKSKLEHNIPKISVPSPYKPKNEALIVSSGCSTQVVESVDVSGYPYHPDEILLRLSLPYLCWRKGMDLAFGLGGLLIMCLVLPVLALLIYLDSPGPIFYSQERLGLQGKPFRMYKFRSMRPDAEPHGHAIWATKGDSRVTRVGRLLRATHMDEFPQVLNILRGDMSLIGPRPEREVYAAQMEKMYPLYPYRLVVKPGLTGWAQVKCGYGNTAGDERTKLDCDLYYIKQQSFFLDIIIILKTVVEVVFCHGR